jgi:glycine cleavage system aminomethyltransferase T
VVGGVIGMAWVPSALASDGARIRISDEGQTYVGEIQTKPFYDPEGEVLRS